MTTTVEELRNVGCKVRVLHHRNRLNGRVPPKGGLTEVIIDTPDGVHLKGKAQCSKKDNYNKKLGVRIALGRALNHAYSY